jgi:hypothetical protein
VANGTGWVLGRLPAIRQAVLRVLRLYVRRRKA